jgi:hypothetical protein
VGKLISVFSILAVPGILVSYYRYFPYSRIPLTDKQIEEFFVSSILSIPLNFAAIILFCLVLAAVYKVLDGYGSFFDFIDLTDHSVAISMVRLFLFPGVVVIGLATNYIMTTEVLFGRFPRFAWLVGPSINTFGPLIAFIVWLIHASITGTCNIPSHPLPRPQARAQTTYVPKAPSTKNSTRKPNDDFSMEL